MNKKLIAVAVASALGTPAVAMAQASTVQIYGTGYIEYSVADQGSAFNGANFVDVDQFQTPGSNIGFKGEEALGGGLSAWFQCESTASMNTAGAAFCSRNSALGFKGGFGNVFLGQWDTPFKRTQGVTRGIVNETGIYGTAFLMGGNSSTYAGNASAGAFIRRQSNTFNYDSPRFGGFQAMAAVSTGQATGTGVTSNVPNSKPRLWSIGLQYVNGPLAVTGAYEKHNNFGTTSIAGTGTTSAAAGSGSDKGWHVGATYTFPVGGGLKVGAIYMRTEYELAAGDAEHAAFQIAGDWKIAGPHGVRAAYVKARDTKGPAAGLLPAGSVISGTGIGATDGNNGADLWQVIYYYTFSKRTEAGIGYVKLDNDSAGRYALGGLPNGRQGNNQDAFAVHVKHTF